MNKIDVIYRLMEKGYTNTEAEKSWSDILSVVEEIVLSGHSVPFRGIGSLRGEIRPSETVKQFGKEVILDQRLLVTFKPSRTIKEKFNNKYSSSAQNASKVKGAIGNLIGKKKQ